MVNPGHASRGCGTCKVRRIRCDARRPTCQQCTQSRRICLGYSAKASKSTSQRKRPSPDVPSAKQLGKRATNSTLNLSIASEFGQRRAKSIDEACRPYIKPRNTFIASTALNPSSDESPRPLLDCACEMLTEGFASLRAQAQSMDQRRALLAKYGELAKRLREALNMPSSDLTAPILLLCLYEMIVNMDTADKTWGIHLDGLLEILGHHPQGNRSDREPLVQAIMFWKQDSPLHQAAVPQLVPEERLCIVLNVAKLQMRSLVKSLRRLFSGPLSPRKLDVQKLLVQVKDIHQNLQLAPHIWDPLDDPDARESSCLLANENRCLLIISSSILIDLGIFLQPEDGSKSTQQYETLKLQEACDIHASAVKTHRTWPPTDADEPSYLSESDTLSALALLWPLKCAFIATAGEPRLQDQIRELLETTGRRAAIPQAVHMQQTSKRSPGTESAVQHVQQIAGNASIFIDVLSGLIIANMAVT